MVFWGSPEFLAQKRHVVEGGEWCAVIGDVQKAEAYVLWLGRVVGPGWSFKWVLGQPYVVFGGCHSDLCITHMLEGSVLGRGVFKKQ